MIRLKIIYHTKHTHTHTHTHIYIWGPHCPKEDPPLYGIKIEKKICELDLVVNYIKSKFFLNFSFFIFISYQTDS